MADLSNIINYRSIILSCFLIMMLAMMLQCTDNGINNPENEVFPDSGLSFTQHIRPVLLESCAANTNCHIGSSPAAQLSLDIPFPTFLSRSGQVVIPFNASQSLLYQVIQGPSNGVPQMPFNRASLSTPRIQAIGRWINEGAVLD